MKVLVIYSSKTGFTEQYARWISEETGCDLIPYKEAKKKKKDFFNSYEAIVFGSWVFGGMITDKEWFVKKADEWAGKKLAIFAVGASEADSPDAKKCIDMALSEDQRKTVKAFYLPGGLNYDKMNGFSKFILKGVANSLISKKDATPEEVEKGKALLTSFDGSDKKYIKEIVSFLK